MVGEHLPLIQQWYKLPDGELFQVLAFNSELSCIEIGYSDGLIEQISLEIWQRLETIPVNGTPLVRPARFRRQPTFDHEALGVGPGTEACVIPPDEELLPS